MPFTYSQFIDLGGVYEFPGGAVTTDFDQDGLPELTFTRFTFPGGIDQEVPIFEVQRDGTLINIASEVIVGGGATSDFGREILVDDINGDGYDDLIIADHGFDADPFPGARNTVLISNGKGHLIDRSDAFSKTDDFTHSVAIGDIDGDGRVDVFFNNLGVDSSYVATIRNDGKVTFDAIPLPGSIDSFTTVELADLDGDGNDEVILGRDENIDRGAKSVIAEWNGKGFDLTELPRNNAFGPNHPMVNLDTNVLDINGDGRQDIVFLQTSADTLYSGMTIQFLIQKGDGSFQDKTSTYMNTIDMDFPNVAFDRWASDIKFADLDQDGDMDFVIQFAFPEGHRVFLQDDTGRFQFSQNDIGGANESLTLVDYDFDGVDEIAAISPGFVVIYDNEELPRDLTYVGDTRSNIFVGTDADEVFQGLGARDTIEAGGGNDAIKGGDGRDKLFGEGGNDVIDGGADKDRILGGAGDDRIRGGDDKDRLIGNAGDDVLNGGGARDKISGGGDNDVIKGVEGNDILLGGGGDDRLEGGTGTDKLNGGRGDDRLKGGADADTFSFSRNGGDDSVLDFTHGEDVMRLTRLDQFETFGQIQAALTQDGAHTVLTHDTGTIRILNTDADTLNAGDFLF